MFFSKQSAPISLASFIVLSFTLGQTITPGFAAENTKVELERRTESPNVDESTLLAQAKTRKKKKNKRKESVETAPRPAEEAPAAPTSVAPGKTMHTAQEGKDKPYAWHSALTSQLGRKESETGGNKSGRGNYQLHLLAAYIIGASFEVGPEITYSEQTTKFEEGDPSVTTAYDAGIRAAYNIGNLDKAVFIPFVSLGFAISSLSNKTGDIESKGSGSKLSIGGGVHYFVDSNVALTGELAYRTGSLKMNGASEASKTTDLDLLNLGFSLFL